MYNGAGVNGRKKSAVFLEKDRIINFFLLFLENGSKPTSKSLAMFPRLGADSNLISCARQRSVSSNALDDSAFRAGPPLA